MNFFKGSKTEIAVKIIVCILITIAIWIVSTGMLKGIIKVADAIEKRSNKVEEKPLNINANVNSKLIENDFTPAGEEYDCDKEQICMTNGHYYTSFGNLGRFIFKRFLKENDSFDSQEDLNLIAKLYNNEKIIDKSTIINELLSIEEYPNVSIHIDGLNISIIKGNGYIEYSISDNLVTDVEDSDIDELEMTIEKDSESRNALFKLLWGENFKQENPVYDIDEHYNPLYDGNTFILELQNNNYKLKETIDNYLRIHFERSDYVLDGNHITTRVSAGQYEGNGLGIIEDDFKYFNMAFDKDYSLSEQNKKEIMDTITKNKSSSTIYINNYRAIIRIENISGKVYYISYTLH